MKWYNDKMLGSSDILVIIKVLLVQNGSWSQNSVAKDLKISSRSVNHGLKKAMDSRLYDPLSRKIRKRPFLEMIEHGISYFIPAQMGAVVRGVPTAWSAEPLKHLLLQDLSSMVVWPSAQGETRGQSISPLHSAVPEIVTHDAILYQMLALVDAVRIGGAREKQLAMRELVRLVNG